FARPQTIRFDAELSVPADAQIAPVLVPLHRLGGMAEELDLHLLEFATTESVVARVDLVAERLADLSNAEGQLEPGAVEDIAEVDEHPLGRLGAKVDLGRIILDSTCVAFKHQVKFAWFGEFAIATWDRAWTL